VTSFYVSIHSREHAAAKWDDEHYLDKVHAVANHFQTEWRLNDLQRFDLGVLLGACFRAGHLAGAAWQREQGVAEIRRAAQHYLEASGNLTQEQKSLAHDTLLVMVGCLKHGLFAESKQEYILCRACGGDGEDENNRASDCPTCKGKGEEVVSKQDSNELDEVRSDGK
jgi:DnaJ-class molecular chaperone